MADVEGMAGCEGFAGFGRFCGRDSPESPNHGAQDRDSDPLAAPLADETGDREHICGRIAQRRSEGAESRPMLATVVNRRSPPLFGDLDTPDIALTRGDARRELRLSASHVVGLIFFGPPCPALALHAALVNKKCYGKKPNKSNECSTVSVSRIDLVVIFFFIYINNIYINNIYI